MNPDEVSGGPDKIPAHIAIIMDGNGRWAQKRGLPRNFGHREGAEALRRIVKVAADMGVKYLTVYAFSTENWSRPDDEVKTLMGLISEYISKYTSSFIKNNVRVKVIGNTEKLDKKSAVKVSDLVRKTENNSGLTFTIAWNYGGRSEIMNAARKIAQACKEGNLDIQTIDEKIFSDNLYTAGTPDPDLVIRTSGEMRISNFLLWQSAYAELFITDTLWPDFKKEDLKEAIESYGKRQRRFGGVKS